MLLDALDEARPLPLDEQITFFVPTNAALAMAANEFDMYEGVIPADSLVDVRLLLRLPRDPPLQSITPLHTFTTASTGPHYWGTALT